MNWYTMFINRIIGNPAVIMLLAAIGGGFTVSYGGKQPTIFLLDIAILWYTIALFKNAYLNHLKVPYKLFVVYVIYLIYATMSVYFANDFMFSVAMLKNRMIPLLILLIAYNYTDTIDKIEDVILAMIVCCVVIIVQMMSSWHSITSGTANVSSIKESINLSWGRSNYLASILLLTPFLSVSMAEITIHRFRKFMFYFAATVMTGGLILSMSRGAMISGMLAIVYAVVIHARYKSVNLKRIIYICFIICGVVYIAHNLIPDSVMLKLSTSFETLYEQSSSPNDISRYQKLMVVLHLFSMYPLGIGLGNQATIYEGGSAHNVFAEAALELGYVGLICIVMIYIYIYLCLYSVAISKYIDHNTKILTLGAVVTFVAAIVNLSEEPSFWGAQYAVFFWVLFGSFLRIVHVNHGRINQVANE